MTVLEVNVFVDTFINPLTLEPSTILYIPWIYTSNHSHYSLLHPVNPTSLVPVHLTTLTRITQCPWVDLLHLLQPVTEWGYPK